MIAVWLKETLSITDLTIDHFHTCYRHMGWQTPRDAIKPLFNMSSASKGWFEKGAGEGAFSITHVGENEVMKMGNPES